MPGPLPGATGDPDGWKSSGGTFADSTAGEGTARAIEAGPPCLTW